MYQNIYFDRFNNEIHLWDDTEGYHRLEYTPYAYIEDPHGNYKTMHGKTVKKCTTWSKDAEAIGTVYEYDIQPEMRMLIDLYDDSDEVSTGHCIAFLDIEVAREKKYSDPSEANNTITAISLYDSVSKEYVCFLLDKDKRIDPNKFPNATIIPFTRERDLLSAFIDRWRQMPITIVTGWNVLWYDLLYLYNRLEKVLGQYRGKGLSPINRVDSFTTKRGDPVFKIAGISILDYMELYKELTFSEKSSFRLGDIAMDELKRGKIEYDKDIDHMYHTDIEKFVEYNLEDVKLVVDLDNLLDFIAIAQGTCHMGHVPYEAIFSPSRYMIGACLTETKRRGIVATKSNVGGGQKAAGAFVKRSRPGVYKWVYDLDATALYPSNLISLNISPETKWAKIRDWNSEAFVRGDEREYIIDRETGETDTVSSMDIRQYIIGNNLSVSANGMLYDLSTVGLIPSLLDRWLSERAEFRSLADVAHNAGDDVTFQYYNRKQKIKKVVSNTLYGVLLLPVFPFYDRDNGEAVTLTGQQIIHFTATMANHFYNNEIGTTGIDYCLYTDTDSVFYESMPIINHRYPNCPEEEIPDRTIQVATEVQNFINKAYHVYAREFHCLKTHRWNIKQELVAKRAFWGSAKKRYAMWIVRDGKKIVDKPDIKGFDSVRSSFPKVFRGFLESVIIQILHDGDPTTLNNMLIDFKNGLSEYPTFDIMNPTGVKDIEKWKPTPGIRYKSKTPVHVKSAMNYNAMMKDKNLMSTPKIESGDKILWAYLSDNPYDFDTLAVRGYDDPPEVLEFLERYVSRDKIFDKSLESKLQTIWDDLGWGTIIMNKNVSKFFQFVPYE